MKLALAGSFHLAVMVTSQLDPFESQTSNGTHAQSYLYYNTYPNNTKHRVLTLGKLHKFKTFIFLRFYDNKIYIFEVC